MSGLNHVAHRIEVKYYEYLIDNYLDQAGYNPTGVPEQTESYVHTMIKKVQILQSLLGKNKTVSLDLKNTSDYGSTDANGHISLNKSLAFSSNRMLSVVVGHELIHRNHSLYGQFSSWERNAKSKALATMYAHNMSEFHAWMWTETVSFPKNWTHS